MSLLWLPRLAAPPRHAHHGSNHETPGGDAGQGQLGDVDDGLNFDAARGDFDHGDWARQDSASAAAAATRSTLGRAFGIRAGARAVSHTESGRAKHLGTWD